MSTRTLKVGLVTPDPVPSREGQGWKHHAMSMQKWEHSLMQKREGGGRARRRGRQGERRRAMRIKKKERKEQKRERKKSEEEVGNKEGGRKWVKV